MVDAGTITTPFGPIWYSPFDGHLWPAPARILWPVRLLPCHPLLRMLEPNVGSVLTGVYVSVGLRPRDCGPGTPLGEGQLKMPFLDCLKVHHGSCPVGKLT